MKVKIYSSMALLSLCIAFTFVSFLVMITNRNSYWVKKKLKIGALILSFSGMAVGCQPQVTCYSPAVIEPTIEFENPLTQNYEIVVDRDDGVVISGHIYRKDFSAFSYTIEDTNEHIIKTNDISADDGAFDDDSEAFSIALGEDIENGSYTFRLYLCHSSEIPESIPFQEFFIVVQD